MNDNHSHSHGHGHHDHSHDHQGVSPAGADALDWSAMLDLDAELLGGYLSEVTTRITSYAGTPRVVLDLGAGTGTGTIALARAFPDAQVIALDAETQMLQQAEATARRLGLGDQVSTRRVDLDAPWPTDLPPADLVWTSSALHHVADPSRLLGELPGALAPGGLLALIEMVHSPTFLPDPALEGRVAGAIDHQGMEPFADWGPTLPACGWDVLDHWSMRQETPGVGEARTAVAALATAFLGRIAIAVSDHIDPTDAATLDRLLDPDHAESLGGRADLVARGHRRAWLARPTTPHQS